MPSAIPSTSLSAASAVGAGATVDFLAAKVNVTMVVIPSGTITGGLITMESSQDGTNWVTHRVMEPMTDLKMGCDGSPGVYRFWRASILTAITGGGTVTTTFMEAG